MTVAMVGALVTSSHLSGEFVLHSFLSVDDRRLALLVRPDVAEGLKGRTPRMADQWIESPSSLTVVDERARPSLALAGSTVEEQLHKVWCDVAAGRLLLHELTPSLLAFYTLGHDHGTRSRDVEVAQANRDADRYYLAAYTPAERAAVIRERMDAAIEALPGDELADSVTAVAAQYAAACPPPRPRAAA